MTDPLSLYASLHPDKPAVIDDRPGGSTICWSFAELERRSNQLANYLTRLGVEPTSNVLWCGPNSASLFSIVNAIRKLGAIAVPLNYRLTADEACYVVDNSDATVIYVDAEYAGLIERIRPQVPKLTQVLVFDGDGSLEAAVAAYPDSPPLPTGIDAPELEAGRTMFYTSGTTGKPKGALRLTPTASSAGAALLGLIGYVADDIYLTTGPMYHSGPGGFASVAHRLGNTVVVQRKFDPEDWLRLVEKHKVTTTFSAPTPIRMVCSLDSELKARYDRSSMKRMIANAAPWSLALKKMYLADFPADSLWEIYGSTELGVDTVLAPEDHLRKPGSCGKPAPGVEISLFDENGEEVTEPFKPGELYVRAPYAFSGYYKAEQKYREATRGDMHTVGDIAYFDDEGYFYIADRKNDMIISGGMNIYPAEVEAALEEHPDVLEAAVFGIPDETWGESVHAVVVSKRHGLTVDEVVTFARGRLAGFKVPRSVTFASELPKTGSGKVLKRELKARLVAP